LNCLSPNHLSEHLIKWYQKYHRHLPWRDTKDAYKIWISEIILQQTRVDQGLPYYNRYVTDYPNVKSFAAAKEDEILKRWQGLGYYSRARNMHFTAKMIVHQFNATFPADYKLLLSLKGVGPYTASAIASIAFNLPHAVVDGNVYRVLSRLFGIAVPVDSNEAIKLFAEKAASLLDVSQPGTHNQAIMELGALICKPANPLCLECPINAYCFAYGKNLQDTLPVKTKKLKIRSRYFNYFLLKHQESVYVNKRPSGDIWQHLYDLPLIESTVAMEPSQIMKTREWEQLFGKTHVHIDSVSKPQVHKLSHQHIHTRFYVITVDANGKEGNYHSYTMVKTADLLHYAVPKPIENIFMEQLLVYPESKT
jgi:A/G-specific adenine glycosylase